MKCIEKKIRGAMLPRKLALALLSLGAFGASAQHSEVLTLDIERQRAGSALMALAGASGVQILVSDEAAAEVEVEGLRGEYEFDEAMAALLTDSGMSWEYASENAVLVQPAEGRVEGEAAEDREDEDEPAAEAVVEEEEDPVELSEQVVTGSRMKRGDPTARVHSLSAEDIARRGVSNLEELFRTLPWAYASMNSQTTLHRPDSVNFDSGVGATGIGISAVNLHALGSANTLVLVNGRRVAGTAGYEDDFANLINVPLSAIERIDIQLDGASAVYGADAIGGVVNFITRKNYTGLSATIREEFSATDADRRNMSLQGGYAWGSGNVTTTASRDRSKPIDNRRIWTSSDFRDRFGPEFDDRRRQSGQPGVVCDWDGGSTYNSVWCDWSSPNRRQLPANHDGRGAAEADFSTDIAPYDYVYPQNGEDSTVASASVRIEQYFADSFRVWADAQLSNAQSYQEFHTQFSRWLIPASNAHNPYQRAVVVSYFPRYEIENGLIPPSFTDSENRQRNFNAGLFWEFGDGHQLEFSATRSESTRTARQVRMDWRRGRFDPTQEAFYAALASSDPNVAPNLFGNGTGQSSALADLLMLGLGPYRGFSEKTSWDALLRGEVFEVRGGAVRYAVGAELRETTIWNERTLGTFSYREDGSFQQPSSTSEQRSIGVAKPARESNALFAEFAVPLVGANNARRGLRSLMLSLQARRDTHKALGAAGGISYPYDRTVSSSWWEYQPDEGWVKRTRTGRQVRSGEARLEEITQSATSPRVGLSYKPVESFTLRAAWSRSFTPPVFSDQFNILSPLKYTARRVDPYHPEGIKDRVRIPMTVLRSNPDIESEYSDNWSLGFEWASESIPGLTVSVDWLRIDYTEKILRTYFVFRDHPEIAFKLPSIVRRDENGYAVELFDKKINIAEDITETFDAAVQYAFDTPWGAFTPRLSYYRVLEDFFRVTPETERVSRVGTWLGTDRYKLTGSLVWTAGRFATDLFVRYTPGYTNENTGSCRTVAGRCGRLWVSRPPLEVDSMTTVDLTVTYRMDNGLRVRAGGRNIFAADNPTVWGNLAYDPTRWDARGRVLYLELNYEL